MPDRQSPTVRRRRLGIELRRLREAADKTIEEVAERLECSASKVSRIETGRVPVRARDVRDMLDMYGVPADEREPLVALSRESRQKGWWHDYSDVLPNWFEVFVGLEAEATTLLAYEPQLVPGLLQTEEYYQAIIDSSLLEPSAEENKRLVNLRISRQQLLTRSENPLRAWFVLDEAVLRRVVGGHPVMHGQLRHLIRMGSRSNVNIQLLPFGSGAHPSMMGSFVIFGFADPTDPKVVYLEHLTNALYLDKHSETDRYTMTFDLLRAAALGPNETATTIDKLTKEYE